jgi:hypothetical protein
MKNLASVILLLFLIVPNLSAQDLGRISGNVQLDAQTYSKDSLIGAPEVPEKFRSNSFLNLIYNRNNLEVGLRYEAYMKPLLGFDPRFEGQGIAYRYATYSEDMFDITVGDFYEQFGSGMIFRAYEERALGLDNAVDGVRVKVRPHSSLEFTGILGKQRDFWNKGDGIIRGADGNFHITDVVKILPEEYMITLGGSLLSRYQADKSNLLKLPENVMAYSGRIALSTYSYTLEAEYAEKINDPSARNNNTFNPGYGLLLAGSYFTDGFGASLNLHKIDNMDFRSDRTASGNQLLINFIPPLTKQHTYRLASMYPFATQLTGEAGVQGEITFRLDNGSLLGGEYGADVNINYSRVNSIDTTYLNRYEYDSPLLSIGDRMFFQDINIEIRKRWSEKVKTYLSYINLVYDKDIMENEGSPKYGKVNAHIAVMDLTYKLKNRNAIRFEVQHMLQEQDSTIKVPDNTNGNWALFLVEYTMAPHWYITVFDEYNYGNDDEDRRIHYLNSSVSYVFGNSRINLGYGRQRGGIICVGGVCRPVPASNGAYLSITSSF